MWSAYPQQSKTCQPSLGRAYSSPEKEKSHSHLAATIANVFASLVDLIVTFIKDTKYSANLGISKDRNPSLIKPFVTRNWQEKSLWAL